MHDEIMALSKTLESAPDPRETQAPLSKTNTTKDLSLMQRASRQCPEMAAVPESVAKAAPSKRSTLLVEGLADAALACNCAADIPAIKELYWYTLSPGRPSPTQYKTLHLAPNATPIVAPKDATWANVHPKILNEHSASAPLKVTLAFE